MILVSFEGIDGSGKSTQARLLRKHLRAEGYDPLLVREPGGPELSERVRELLLDTSLDVDPFAELLLFSAARAQLVAEQVRPALDAGRIVICDRFYDSTTAYQGAGRGVAEVDWLRAFHRRVTGGLTPDRTYLVEVPLDLARERRSGEVPDRMEAGDGAFYERVAAAYAALAEDESARFRRLDGSAPIDALHAQVRDDVHDLLGARSPEARSSQGEETKE
jgi:dTMP kinase